MKEDETLEEETLKKSVRFLDKVDKRKVKKARLMEKAHPLLVRFPPRIWDDLSGNAAGLGMSCASYVRMCVETKNKEYRAKRAKYLRDVDKR